MAFMVGGDKIEYEENGEILAEVCFPALEDNLVDLCHTYVSDKLRGQGMAGRLMERAAEELRKTNRRAVLTCSYAIKWFSEHEGYDDILKA
jgi:predicted GNAT family acetyltransferase